MPGDDRGRVDARLQELHRLRTAKEHQTRIFLDRSRWLVLNQNKSAVAILCVSQVIRDLMRGQAHLAPMLHDLQLEWDELAVTERQEAVWDAEVYPRLNPGNKAA